MTKAEELFSVHLVNIESPPVIDINIMTHACAQSNFVIFGLFITITTIVMID